MSYSLYLWHFMILWALGWGHPMIALPIGLACAWLSYRFIERPFRSRRSVLPATAMRTPVPEPIAASAPR
jgi:peptidoglycan/LPS O-acetylase OafA/YrhL